MLRSKFNTFPSAENIVASSENGADNTSLLNTAAAATLFLYFEPSL